MRKLLRSKVCLVDIPTELLLISSAFQLEVKVNGYQQVLILALYVVDPIHALPGISLLLDV